jgi:hypothetical protein
MDRTLINENAESSVFSKELSFVKEKFTNEVNPLKHSEPIEAIDEEITISFKVISTNARFNSA